MSNLLGFLKSGFLLDIPDIILTLFISERLFLLLDNQPPKPVRFDNDKYGSIVSSNVDSYLTPSNSRDRLQQSCRDGYNAMSDSLNDASNTSSPSEQDKLCISVEKCAVAFTNSPEEDIESDETDLLHAKMI